MKFPIVMKNKSGTLVIIYKNRVETYKFQFKETKTDIDKSNGDNVAYDFEKIYGKGWNAYHEVNMFKNNGFKTVNIEKEIEVEK